MEDTREDSEEEEELRGSLVKEAFSWRALRKLCRETAFRDGFQETALKAEEALQTFLRPYHTTPHQPLDFLFEGYNFQGYSSGDEESLASDSEEIDESSDPEVDIDDILQNILYDAKERPAKDIPLVNDPIDEAPQFKSPSPKAVEVKSPSPKVIEVRSPSPKIVEAGSPLPEVDGVRPDPMISPLPKVEPSPLLLQVNSSSSKVFQVRSPSPEVKSPEITFLRGCHVKLNRLSFEEIESKVERVDEIASPDLPPLGKCTEEPPPNLAFGPFTEEPLTNLELVKRDVAFESGYDMNEEELFTRRSQTRERGRSSSRESSNLRWKSKERNGSWERGSKGFWEWGKRDKEHQRRNEDFEEERRGWTAQRWRGFNKGENRCHPARNNRQNCVRGSWNRRDREEGYRKGSEKSWFKDEITGEWKESGGNRRDFTMEEWFRPKSKVFNSKFEEEMDECWNGPHIPCRGQRSQFHPKQFNNQHNYYQRRSDYF